MKYILMLLTMVILISLVGCSTTETSSVDISSLSVANDVIDAAPERIELEITAKNWEFIPSTITVQKDKPLRLRVMSIDVAHGFRISEFGINERLEPNQEVVIDFTPDKVGTFSFFCNVYCGRGHGGMKGTLAVEE